MMNADRIERARAHRIEDVIESRDINLRGRVERVGPCPVCGGSDRFAINIRKQVWHCRGCRAGGDVVALIRHLDGVGFREAVEILGGNFRTVQPVRISTSSQAVNDYEAGQHRKAQYLWHARQPLTGSIAETYLRKARGYRGLLPATLAFSAPRKVGHHPALIACFAICESELGVLKAPHNVDSVHLTLLKPDGSDKIASMPRLIIGSPRGCPIMIAPPGDLLGLAITEGIEDGLSVYAAIGLGVWAAGSAGFMPKLADSVPDYIECVTIFAHADQAGQAGAKTLAESLNAKGTEVLIEGMQ